MKETVFSLAFWALPLPLGQGKRDVTSPGLPPHLHHEICVPPRKHHNPPKWPARRDSPPQRIAGETRGRRRSGRPPLLLHLRTQRPLPTLLLGLIRPPRRHPELLVRVLVRQITTALPTHQPLQQRPPLPPRAMQARRLLPRPPLIASANAHLRPPFPVPMRHHRSRLILQGTCDVGTMPSAAASSRGTPTSKPTCSTTY